MGYRAHIKKITAGLGLVAALTAVTMTPAFAAGSSVTVGVTSSGTLAASYADKPLTPIAYSLVVQTTPSEDLTLTASDGTGTAAGWNVTVISSDFLYGGSYAGTAIPAANFVFGTPNTPTVVGTDGSQVVSTTLGEGPEAGVGGSMDVSRKVMKAGAAFGQGTYAQTVGATLAVPAKSLVGTYTGTLTTTITAGP